MGRRATEDSDPDGWKAEFEAFRTRVNSAITTAGYTLRWEKNARFVSLKGFEFRLQITRVWSKNQARYYPNCSDKTIRVKVRWYTRKDDQQEYVQKLERFDLRHMLKRIQKYATYNLEEASSARNVELLQETQQEIASGLMEKHGLQKQGRLRVISESKAEGYEVMIRKLTADEADELLTVLKRHMNRI